MKENPRSTYSRPASGGLMHLQGRLTDLRTWLGPAWAALCGVVASHGFGGQGPDWLRLALLILLVDAGWGTLWAALGSTDWATPLRRWRNWHLGASVKTVPYTLPGSPGDQASRWLGQLRAWWHDIFWVACGPAISAIVVALPVTLLLGAMLGSELLLLSVAALAVMQLGLAWDSGRGRVAPVWDAAVAVTFPWLTGHVGFRSLTLSSAGLALAFALAWGAAWRAESAWGRVLVAGAQFLATALFVVLQHPLTAGCMLLLLVPQLALMPWLQRGKSVSWYVRNTRPWLMAAMLVAAWAL
jgi:hypothetical protein